jgi:hypothetical protein
MAKGTTRKGHGLALDDLSVWPCLKALLHRFVMGFCSLLLNERLYSEHIESTAVIIDMFHSILLLRQVGEQDEFRSVEGLFRLCSAGQDR